MKIWRRAEARHLASLFVFESRIVDFLGHGILFENEELYAAICSGLFLGLFLLSLFERNEHLGRTKALVGEACGFNTELDETIANRLGAVIGVKNRCGPESRSS